MESRMERRSCAGHLEISSGMNIFFLTFVRKQRKRIFFGGNGKLTKKEFSSFGDKRIKKVQNLSAFIKFINFKGLEPHLGFTNFHFFLQIYILVDLAKSQSASTISLFSLTKKKVNEYRRLTSKDLNLSSVWLISQLLTNSSANVNC